MINLQLFQIFLLLWQLINVLTLPRSLANPYCSSTSFLLPSSVEANFSYCFDDWFDPDYISSANNSLFIKRVDLDVQELSLGGDKRGYYVDYCLTVEARSPFKIFDTEASGSMNHYGAKLCKYGLFVDKKCYEYISNIKQFHREDEIHCGQLNITDIQNFYIEVLPIDANKGNSQLRLEKKIDESKYPNILFRESLKTLEKLGYNRFCKPWLLSAIGVSLGGLILFMGKCWLCTIIKKTKNIKLVRKFFKTNGGSLLEQMLNSYDGSVDRCKLFDAKELDKATDHFNVNRILGEGGQGTVYKGMLEDGRIIAVKKSKVVDGEKLEEFINELLVLSQINHRNVVKLLGCCLETEVPLLIYEFIPNGTLSQYIHNRNEEFQLTWEIRLRIATEVAGALSYIHSSTATPIYHRDIKSTNILLDEKYSAKVGDFGTSKFVATDQTHVSTVILGTLGYLDPEYHQSSQLTDKSDVYSFGVVLAELLTGEKPIFSSAMQGNINLAKYFIHAMKENRLHDILDDQVKQMGKKEEIMAFANLAKRCLNMKRKERPTMKEVAMELEAIRVLKKKKPILSKIAKIFSC